MKQIILAASILLVAAVSQADVTVTPWTPIFKGIEHAVGQLAPPGTNILGQTIGASISSAQRQVVHVLRVDLTDPDIQLFTDPRCTNCGNESLALSTTNFVKTYGVQVAVNANFFQNPEPQSEATPWAIVGQHISRGQIVSPQDTSTDSAGLLFTINKQFSMVLNNFPPTNTAGTYTAVSGRYPLVINGLNVGNNATSPIPGLDPRTAIGASADGRYLILMTVDGRQGGWSDGSIDDETGAWLLAFGAYNAVNMDGGGSTTMAFADCAGNAREINRNAYSWAEGRTHERIIPSHLGVFAKPLQDFINDVKVTPRGGSAAVSWTTVAPATSQIQYGLTPGYGSSTPLDSTPMTTHYVTLFGLAPNTTYYYQIVSATQTNQTSTACTLHTLSDTSISIFPITQSWRWNTSNLDTTPDWMTRTYIDSTWSGPNIGLLCDENSFSVSPRNTQLPPNFGAQSFRVAVFPTYYFRTHFNFSGSTAGVILTFNNYVDDGAVFYLNGAEIQRIRMPAGPLGYTTTTGGLGPCAGTQNAGDAATTCPDVFTVSGDLITNLLSGDNLVAVEVHQSAVGGLDMTFGSALSYSRPSGAQGAPTLNIVRSGAKAVLSWTGSGFALQQATAPTGTWTFVSGPATAGPYTNTLSGPASFFRLRN